VFDRNARASTVNPNWTLGQASRREDANDAMSSDLLGY